MTTPTARPLSQTIPIVDDPPENLTVLGEFMQPNYRVRVSHSGTRAWQVATLAPQPEYQNALQILYAAT